MYHTSQDVNKAEPSLSAHTLFFHLRPLHLIIAVAFILFSLAPIKFDIDQGSIVFTEVLAKGGDDDDDDDDDDGDSSASSSDSAQQGSSSASSSSSGFDIGSMSTVSPSEEQGLLGNWGQ